jgi:hypothetical protein
LTLPATAVKIGRQQWDNGGEPELCHGVVDPGLYRVVLLPTVIVGLRGHDLVEIPLLPRIRELVGTTFRELEDAALSAAFVPVDVGSAECSNRSCGSRSNVLSR